MTEFMPAQTIYNYFHQKKASAYFIIVCVFVYNNEHRRVFKFISIRRSVDPPVRSKLVQIFILICYIHIGLHASQHIHT